MIITLWFKNPDIDFLIEESLKEHSLALGYKETNTSLEDKKEKIKEGLRKYLEYGEALSVSYDTESGVMEVIPNR